MESSKISPGSSVPARPGLALDHRQRERLSAALAEQGNHFDEAASMIRLPFSSPGYHTTLTGGEVHPIRQSLNYAVALLDEGGEATRARAVAIFDRVLGLQDTDPGSPTYGIWSWFLEEPLAQMRPPDWNWADFCGTQLLEAILTHRHELPGDLAARMDAAIVHAARSIQRRDVQPSYTNIAIMGSFVTLAAAEAYEIEDLRLYALRRLERFVAYTAEQGGFTEYNSPAYTLVALNELLRIKKYAADPRARVIIDMLYRRAWEEIADHFHAPTMQWAGPHSRSYGTLLSPDALATLQRAVGPPFPDPGAEPSVEEHRLVHECPDDLRRCFFEFSESRAVRRTLSRDTPPLVTTTWLHPRFCLGSVNRGDLWNQRRSLVAYWGEAGRAQYLHLRFLHDGYDFSAAQFFSVQREGQALAAVNFATDGGDRHISLDPLIDGKFRARDLRLRFEFGGALPQTGFAPVPDDKGWVRLEFGDLRCVIALPIAQWESGQGGWESCRENGTASLDFVFYSGEERQFNLTEIGYASAGIALMMGTDLGDPSRIGVEEAARQYILRWDGLELGFAKAPAKCAELITLCSD